MKKQIKILIEKIINEKHLAIGYYPNLKMMRVSGHECIYGENNIIKELKRILQS